MTTLPLSRMNMLILGACAALGVAGYVAVGHPGMSDQPMSARQAGLAEKIRNDPQSLSPAETLSRLEQATKDNPDAPEPHFFIGEMLRQQNRPGTTAKKHAAAPRLV